MDQPKLITTPFAQDAPSGAVDEIPETLAPSDPLQNASWTQGFPNVTMVPLAAGGIPPRGQSMNGVLNAISEHSAFVGGGGQYKWDQDWVNAQGGYAKDAVVQSDDGLASYVSAVDGNTDNFNSDSGVIGTSWLPYSGAVKIDSAGTGIEKDGTALRVRFGTTAGTVMQGNDNRIAGALQKSANLGDLDDAPEARDNLGLGTAATADVTTSMTDQTEGRVMTVGYGNLGRHNTRPINNPNDFNTLRNGTYAGYISGPSESDGWPVWGDIHMDYTLNMIYNASGGSPRISHYQELADLNNSRVYLRCGRGDPTGNYPWYEYLTTRNITQSTGQSTLHPMSQKAVSDQLLGVGQTWQDVTASRGTGTTYTNTAGRTIVVSIVADPTTSDEDTSFLEVDGLRVASFEAGGAFRKAPSFTAVVPNGSSYKMTLNNLIVHTWAELR